MCSNPYASPFCSVGLQADTLDASTCPPEGGRYIDQNQVLTQPLKARKRNFWQPGRSSTYRSHTLVWPCLAFANVPGGKIGKWTPLAVAKPLLAVRRVARSTKGLQRRSATEAHIQNPQPKIDS